MSVLIIEKVYVQILYFNEIKSSLVLECYKFYIYLKFFIIAFNFNIVEDSQEVAKIIQYRKFLCTLYPASLNDNILHETWDTVKSWKLMLIWYY